MDLFPRDYLFAGLAVFIFWWIIDHSRHKQRYIRNVPIVGGKANLKRNRQEFVTNSLQILRTGYEENNGELFYVPTPIGERLIIPGRYLEELKSADMAVVDFQATFLEMFEGAYTTLGTHSRLLPQVVRAQLNQYLPDVLPEIQCEIRDSVTELFPPCQDWTVINVTELMAVLVARVSSRMFGGPALSQNREWIEASLRFAHDGFNAAQKLKMWPDTLKFIGQHFIPEVRSIKNTYKIAERAIIPLLDEREVDKSKKAHDLLTWMYDQAQGAEKDKKFIAGTLLKVSFAAYHTSAAAPTQLLFDIAAMPEHIAPLLGEYLSAPRDNNQNISVKGFAQMVKLDSIMKESQRFNPLLLLTFERIIKRDFTLSDGVVIPANTWIGCAAQAIGMDRKLYPDPDTFDAFRFVAKEEATATSTSVPATKAHYTSANPGSMAFGYGQHACPGRFFAMMEIKAIIGEILSRFEMRLADGEMRPPSVTFETQHLPHPAGKVLFKRRRCT
ncbi:cytochrome P450 [Aspergillus flavus]|nr:cytochrome P450 [Aspergillus flavus]